MNKYMHTLNGRPAYFDTFHNLVFFARYRVDAIDLLVPNLRTLKHQQSLCRAQRLKDNYGDRFEYGYILVKGIEHVA